MDVLEVARNARVASLRIRNASNEARVKTLLTIAQEIDRERQQLRETSIRDAEDALKIGVAAPLVKRLKLDDSKIADMVDGVRSLVRFEDPLGKTLLSTEMDSGLELYKVTCPIGVIGAIFESRPDALVQIAALCLKSGNAVILKGGSEAAKTNQFLAGLLRKAIRQTGEIPEDSVQLVETREDVSKLLDLDSYIDLLVPRGSSSLVKYVKENTKIPVLGHTEGLCHEFVDEYATLDMAIEICYDAKVQYPAVCNAMNSLLVHAGIAERFLPSMAERYKEANVELRGDARARQIVKHIKMATEKDWRTEYLDLILSIKIVDSLDEAIDHINNYSAHHTDGIITENRENAKKFLNEVDSAVVMHNASTRFSDGYRFGFGAEVGISTQRTHARGPVGLEGLVTYKYIVAGSGQIVSSYVGNHAKPFTHRKLNKTWNPQA
ncbi:MAG: glutamate-5-semialdehyde dehydrogenase [archaeon]